jgi:hypothetical protein
MLSSLCNNTGSQSTETLPHWCSPDTSGGSTRGLGKAPGAGSTGTAAGPTAQQDTAGFECVQPAVAPGLAAAAGQPLAEPLESGQCRTAAQNMTKQQQPVMSPADISSMLPAEAKVGSQAPLLRHRPQAEKCQTSLHQNGSSTTPITHSNGGGAQVWRSSVAAHRGSTSWCRHLIRDLWRSGTTTKIKMLDSGSGASAGSFWMKFKEDVSVVCVLEVTHALLGVTCLGCRGAPTLVSNLVRSLDAGSMTQKEV